MDPYVFFMIGSAGAGAAGVVVRRLTERRRAARKLASVPEAHTGLADGTVVRVSGIVRAVDELLVSALSGTPCVMYRARVRGRGTKQQQPIGETFATSRFALDRGADGTAIIDGSAAMFDLPLTPKRELTSERKDRFLLLHGFKYDVIGHGYEEVTIVPGATLSVIGLVMTDVAPDPTGDERGFRDEQALQIRIVGDAEHPLVIGRVRI